MACSACQKSSRKKTPKSAQLRAERIRGTCSKFPWNMSCCLTTRHRRTKPKPTEPAKSSSLPKSPGDSNDRTVLQQVVQGDDVEIARWGSEDVCLDTAVSMAATWSHPCTTEVRNLKELSRTNVDHRCSERCETETGLGVQIMIAAFRHHEDCQIVRRCQMVFPI